MLGAAHDGTSGDDDEVEQLMSFVAMKA